MRRWRVATALTATVLLGGVTAMANSESILTGMCRWLDVGEIPRCADHVLLLPGDDTYRPIAAAALIKAGLARDVLVPENDINADVTDEIRPPSDEILRRILLHRGIPNDRIVSLEGASRTTFDDACALSEYLEQRPEDRVIVVTNAFHTRRVRLAFRRVLESSADRLQVCSAPNPGFEDQTWWHNRFSTNLVLSENLKLGFYVFRYSRAYVWIGSLLLIALIGGWSWWHWTCRDDGNRETEAVPRPTRGRQRVGQQAQR